MAAVVSDSLFRTLLCTLSTCHLDPVASCESPCQTPWRSRTLHIACTTLGVSGFATILHSRNPAPACCPLHQEPGKSRTGLSLSNLSSSCQSERPCQAWILLAFSVASCPFTWASNSTMSATPSPIYASAICRTSLTFPTKLVPIVCMLTATWSPSRLLVAAPFLTGRLLSCSAVLYCACSLIAFVTNSWARSRKESASHIECMSSTSWISRLSTCVFACRLSRLLRAGLTIFVKRCCTISRTSFMSFAPTPCSFMIFSKSARESHTLPPAKLLRQNSTGLASDFRLRSAFDVISSDPLSSDVSLPLSAWNFARVSFSSIHSANTVGERSNFLTLALHLFSVDGSSRPFQSTRFRYSCIIHWVVRWSPCA